MDLADKPVSPAPVRLRVVTYNVFQARYLEEPPAPGVQRDAGRSVLRDFATLPPLHSADVILLQEALVGMTRTAAAVDTVATLARSLGIDAAPNGLLDGLSHTAFLGSVVGARSSWGLGAVSRVPARFTPVPLPNAWWSRWPRAALFAEIGPWILATVHLEVWPVGAGARRRQMQTVIDALLEIPGNSTRPVVLAGDFNCETGGAHQVMQRNGFEPVPVPVPTWSLGPLALRLDHVYVRNAQVVATGVEQGARGSDHLPLWVDVERLAGAGQDS